MGPVEDGEVPVVLIVLLMVMFLDAVVGSEEVDGAVPSGSSEIFTSAGKSADSVLPVGSMGIEVLLVGLG